VRYVIAALFAIAFTLATTTGDAFAKPADVCKMVSANDTRAWFGKELSVSEDYLDKPQSSQCTWDSKREGAGFLMVQIVPARYYEPHRGADYTPLSGIGDKAFFVTDLGFLASAVKGSKAIAITLRGGSSTRATAISALKMLVRKM